MEYTDDDVPVNCEECGEIVEGIEAMRQHLIINHKNYTPEDVEKFARLWIEGAHEEVEEEDRAYHADRAYEKAVDTDIQHWIEEKHATR